MRKKAEFLSMIQTEGMSMIEYQAQFLTLDRFGPSHFVVERERVAQYVSGQRISIRLVIATFLCSTLVEATVRALECEHTHESHH